MLDLNADYRSRAAAYEVVVKLAEHAEEAAGGVVRERVAGCSDWSYPAFS